MASSTSKTVHLAVFLTGAALVLSCRGTSIVGVPGTGKIAAVDFGRVIVGETVDAPFTVQNVQGNDFHLTAAPAFTGADATDFQVAAAPPSTVREGKSVSGRISFKPQGSGARNAQVAIASDSAATPSITGDLTGVGIDPASLSLVPNPTALIFGQVEIQTTKNLPLRITNTGSDPAPFLPASFSGTGAAEYAITVDTSDGGGRSPLQPGATLSLVVSFTPPVEGDAPATLQIQACQVCAPLEIPITGIGFAPGLVFDPPVLAFSAFRGETQSLPIQIVNQGNATADLTAILSSDPVFIVSIDAPMPAHLPHGGSLSFSVTYAPPFTTFPGTVNQAQLTPTVNAANEQYTPGILNGTVPADCRLASPSSLFLGYSVPPYSTHQTLSLSNSGSDTCELNQLGFSSDTDPAFTLGPPPPATLSIPAGSDAGLEVTFAPADSSPPSLRQGTLQMQTNDVNLPNPQIQLSGYAQDTPFAAGSPWPRRCHDNGNSCLSDVDTSATGPTLRWRTYLLGSPAPGTPDKYWQGPAIGGDGTLYQYSVNAELNALDPAGHILWSTHTAPAFLSTGADVPTIAAGDAVQLITFTETGAGANTQANPQYFGVAADSRALWATATPAGEILDGPLLRPDGVAVIPLSANGDPAATGVASYADGLLTSFFSCPSCDGPGAMASDGTSYWTALDENAVSSIIQLLPDGGVGFEINVDFDCDGVQLRAEKPMLQGSELYLSASDILPDGGVVLAVGAFDVSAGLRRDWQYCDVNDNYGAALALAPDGGIVISWAHLVYGEGVSAAGFAWIDPPGTPRWVYQRPFPSAYAPHVAVGGDGSVYFIADFAALVALNPSDGTVRWAVDSGVSGASAPAIGADGTVYFQDADGVLNAVR